MAFEIAGADGYIISDDPARFDMDRAHRWIAAAAVCLDGLYAVVAAGRARSIPEPPHAVGAVLTARSAQWQSLIPL